MRQQYLAADRTKHEIRVKRRAYNSPTPLLPTAAPYYYPGWTHYDVVQEYHVWHMFHTEQPPTPIIVIDSACIKCVGININKTICLYVFF